jgi:hypothetical protein
MPNLIKEQNNDFGCTIDLSWSKLVLDIDHKCDGKFDEKIQSYVLWIFHDQRDTYLNIDCKFDKGKKIRDLGCVIKLSQWTSKQEMRRKVDGHSSRRHELNEAFLAS